MNKDLIFHEGFVKVKEALKVQENNDMLLILRKYFTKVGFFANFCLLYKNIVLLLTNLDYLRLEDYEKGESILNFEFVKTDGEWVLDTYENLSDTEYLGFRKIFIRCKSGFSISFLLL
jgi:hypothetical protein